MADNREIVGWFYRNGKRIPLKKGKGHAKTKSGWDKPFREYSGADRDYQHLYKGGKRQGRVLGWEDDGDFGYNAHDKNKKFLGNYETRAEAQKAVEKNASKTKRGPARRIKKRKDGRDQVGMNTRKSSYNVAYEQLPEAEKEKYRKRSK